MQKDDGDNSMPFADQSIMRGAMKELSFHTYLNKLHGCYLGKAIGGTLGMPREGAQSFAEVTYYDPVPTGMVANDDLDLQVVALEVIRRRGLPVNARDLSACWSEHLRFYPDEYGVAAKNLSVGLYPPLSGRYTNKFGAGMGAAIRSELWAGLAPADPALAVQLCREDAINDHFDDGVDACIFLTAIESAAFTESERDHLIQIGLSYIQHNQRMTAAFTDTMRWWEQYRDVTKVRGLILEHYFAQNWTDVTINLSFILLAWMAGENDFSRCICIAASLGYDADCTCATLGAILGMIHPEGIDEKWTKPIGNQLVLSENIIATHEPDTVDGFIALVAETMRDVIKYYGASVSLTDLPETAEHRDTPVWCRRHELVTAREGTSLVCVRPLVIRMKYPEQVALDYNDWNTLVLDVANANEQPLNAELAFGVPEGWRVCPASASCALKPGEECRIELKVHMPERERRACRSMLDITLLTGGMRTTVEAGLIEPYRWLRIPADQLPDGECPEDACFKDAQIVAAPGCIAPVPVGHWFYAADVRAIMVMPRIRMVSSGTRPLRVWINGQLVADHDDQQYVPAIHRSKDVVTVDLHNDWNRVVIEVLPGDEKPGELFFTFGHHDTWQWFNELGWRLPQRSN